MTCSVFTANGQINPYTNQKNISEEINQPNTSSEIHNIYTKNSNRKSNHDISIQNIIKPADGHVNVITPMIQIQNLGDVNELDVPITLMISKDTIFGEEFSHYFPPPGWVQQQTEEWRQSNTNWAGGLAPEAKLDSYDVSGNTAFLQSSEVNPSELTTLQLEFKSYIDYYSGSFNCSIKTRCSESNPWADVTPWINPVSEDIGPCNYMINLSSEIGPSTQIIFECNGSTFDFVWFIDDVRLAICPQNEYNITTFVHINASETKSITFPNWTPSDFHLMENNDIRYSVVGNVLLENDSNPSNNLMNKDILLHFGYSHDISIIDIDQLESGYACPKIPKVFLTNNGQYNEVGITVTMRIDHREQTSEVTEDFETNDGGYLPSGTQNVWQWGAPTSGPGSAHSGENLWATVLNGNYPNNANAMLETPTFIVPNEAVFSFWHWYNMENYCDGGNVKLSTDNGTSWTIIAPQEGYPMIATSANMGIPSEPCFSGQSQQWLLSEFNISAYAGQTVKIRFHFGSDFSNTRPGWYIDDVTLTAFDWINEYNETKQNIPLCIEKNTSVTFPEWTPSSPPLNVTVDYRAVAHIVNISGSTILLNESFNTFPPPGWSTGPTGTEWMQSYTNYAGGVIPEAWCPKYESRDFLILMSPWVDTSSVAGLTLEFKSFIDDSGDSNSYECLVRIISDNNGGEVQPWRNLIRGDQGPDTYMIDITPYIGNLTDVRFIVHGWNWDLDGWYVDDVRFLSSVGTILDEYQNNNQMILPFTLEYPVHDVGVAEILDLYTPPPLGVDWVHYDGENQAAPLFSNSGTIEAAARVTPTELTQYNGWLIRNVKFYHGAQGETPPPAHSGEIKFYGENTPEHPGNLIASVPFTTPPGNGWVEIPISPPIWIDATEDLWTSVEIQYNPGEYTIGVDGGPVVSEKGDWLSLNSGEWVELQDGGWYANFNIQISVEQAFDDEAIWSAGTYPIQAIIKNYGTSLENNFNVHAEIWSRGYGGEHLYWEDDVFITDPLNCSESRMIDFGNVTFNEKTYIGETKDPYIIEYKLIVTTSLSDDENVNNNEKHIYFFIIYNYQYPPHTYARMSGTMGWNDWYTSSVTVTLSTYYTDFPPGVNYTMYKVDNGEWTIYTTPIVVDGDGIHIVYFYSVGNDGSIEETHDVFFRIDQTIPSITMSTEKNDFRQWKFIANVSDMTSGVYFVQLYLDNQYIGNITEPGPYEWNWTGKGNHTVTGIVYDQAGNSAENSVSFSFALRNSWNQNYWNQPHMFPKLFFGKIGKFSLIPWINVDWYPAQEPYDSQG